MQRSPRRAGSRKKAEEAGSKVPRRRGNPEGLSHPQQVEDAANAVFNSLGSIIDALVAKAEAGSCQHAKCVFEFARVMDVEMKREQKAEPWVTELMNALRALPEPTETPIAV